MVETFPQTEEVADIKSVTDVSNALAAIRGIDEEIEDVKDDAAKHRDWFKERIESKERSKAFWIAKLEKYMDSSGGNSISLPNGRVYFRRTPRHQWPDDEVLIAFSQQHHIPVNIKQAPVKADIIKYINETGEAPAGYSKTHTINLTVSPK